MSPSIRSPLVLVLWMAAAATAIADEMPTLKASTLSTTFTPNGDMVKAYLTTEKFKEELIDRSFFLPKELENLQVPAKPEEAPHRAGLFLHMSADWPKYTDLVQFQATSTQPKPDEIRFEVTDPTGSLLPRGVKAIRTYKVDEAKHFQTEVSVEISNLTTEIIDLKNPVRLELGPALDKDTRNPAEVFAKVGDALTTLSLTAEPKAVDGEPTYIGLRNNYFAMVFEKLEGDGSFTVRNLQPKDVKKGEETPGPVLGFQPKAQYLKPNEKLTMRFRLYMGPKTAEALGPSYGLVFNNWDGWTGFIGKAMFGLLQLFYAITGSYGLSILLLTLLVKVLLHPLTRAQTESMAKMTKLQPKLQELREKHKDAQRLNQEMMKLYKEHQVNPLGGCFPILLQIPVFIALYSCLQSAIELKNQSFWWLPDLAEPDPTLILPILFALSIYFSSKIMSPTPATPGASDAADMARSQALMMRWMMPLMMLAIMKSVSGGVMIYLCGQSVLGVFEQKWTREKLGLEKTAEAAEPPRHVMPS